MDNPGAELSSVLSLVRNMSHDLYIHSDIEEQPVCNIMLPLSFCGLLNISEYHLVILLNLYGVLYTPTPILGVYP